MHRGFHGIIAALVPVILGCTGCTQMTRHSNMIVFGTNTVVGLRVGADASQTPSIDVGYSRREAALMPVVANSSANDDGTLLQPCNPGTSVAVVAGTPQPPANSPLPAFATHPCLLVASDGREAKDSYSVLASFGASFDASAEAKGPNAGGGLAQYFATGMAAQLLALNGGAAVVATGQAAEKAAEKPPLTLEGVQGLTPTQAEIATAQTLVADYMPLRTALAAKIRGTDVGSLPTQLGKFQQGLGGSPRNLSAACTTPDACASVIEADLLFSNYRADPKKFSDAVTAWGT